MLRDLVPAIAGLSITIFLIVALIPGRDLRRSGRIFLIICFADAFLDFLGSFLTQGGFLDLHIFTIIAPFNYLYGIPALFAFSRLRLEKATVRLLPPFLPLMIFDSVWALSCTVCFIFNKLYALKDIATYLPFFLFVGETIQLWFFGQKIKRLISSNKLPTLASLVWDIFRAYLVIFILTWLTICIDLISTWHGIHISWIWMIKLLPIMSLLIAACLIGTNVYRNPELLARIDQQPRYRGTILDKKKAVAILASLDQLLRQDPHLDEDSSSPRKLSDRLNIPYYLLSRAVNENLGKSLSELVNDHRVERAKTLITNTPEHTMLDIAFTAGFSSKTIFNKCFKDRTGQTPSEYRKKLLGRTQE